MKYVSFNRKIILLLIFLICPASFFLAYVGTVDFLVATACSLGALAMLLVNWWDVHEDVLLFARKRVGEAREMMDQGKLDASKLCLEEAVSCDPNNFDAIVVRGELYLAENQCEDAYRELQRACEIDPQSFRVHFALGLTYLQDKKAAEAVSEFKQAIKLKQEFSESYFLLASAFELADEKDKAVISYRKFLEVITSDELKNEKMAICYEKSKARIRVLS